MTQYQNKANLIIKTIKRSDIGSGLEVLRYTVACLWLKWLNLCLKFHLIMCIKCQGPLHKKRS